MNKLDKIKLSWYSSYKLNKIRETIRSLVPSNKLTKIIFIFGCQRSGTTIIQKLISLNTSVKFYGEGDPPYFHNSDSKKHHRIMPTKKINDYLNKESLDVVVIKPLYESHIANQLINSHADSRGIWVFRNYLDVIDSHLHYYNYNVLDYVSPLFSDDGSSWLNEYISDDIRKFIKQFNLKEISEPNAYALFWIARNSLYLNVVENKNILLVNYEKLITSPEIQITRFCDFSNLAYCNFYSKMIRVNAMSKNVNFKLNSKIEDKCQEIYNTLLEHC